MPIEGLTPALAVPNDVRAGRPWWKVCCGGCCLFIVIILVGLGLLWRGIGGIGSGPSLVATVPGNFPPSVTLFMLDKAKSIEYFSGHDKNRTFATLLKPLRFFGSVMVSSSVTDGLHGTTTSIGLDKFMDASTARLEQIDTVTIYWEHLPATKEDLYRFYLEQFQRNGYVVETQRDDASMTDNIVGKRQDVTVQLQVQDLPDVEGVDTVTVTVDYVNDK